MSGSFVVAGGGVGRVVHVGDENYAAELTRKAKTKKNVPLRKCRIRSSGS